MTPRRRHAALVLGLALSMILTACGSDDASSDSRGSSDSSRSSGEDAGSAFPVTVEHKYGTTVVKEEPQRVVSVGLTEHDVLLQLGVTPVAVTEWYGEKPYATWPWAEELLGDAEPEVLSTADGLEFEKIAALDPDLIVGTNAGLTEKDYDLLSAIAPTVTSVEGSTPYFSSWQDQTLQIARSVGREEEGQGLVDEVEAAYAKAAAAHPDWASLSGTFSQGSPYDGQLYVYPDGLNTDFLTDLGFSITPGLEKYAPEEGSQAAISEENVGLIEADVILFATESEQRFDELMEFGTVSALAAVKEERAIYTDDTLAGAIYFLTPLSQMYVLDHLVPALEKATSAQMPREFPTGGLAG